MTEPVVPGAATPAPPPPTLLLVDDEPSVLSALRRLFRTAGYRIEQATSGADALALMAEHPVDLVISDMRMPEMDGAAFLEQVRERHPQVLRMLLTGYADIGATVAAINRGAIHRYIAKPWDDQDLLGVVADGMRRVALERENQALQAQVQAQLQALADLNHGLEARVAERTAELERSHQQLLAANAEVEAHFMLAVTVFSGLLEMRQDVIAGHARRVADLARRMAGKLHLDEAAQREVQLAALLHDIGKIGYPDEMLGKPVSRLNAEEMARYHRHPLDAEAALMPLDKLHGVATIVRQHHERVDGRGFPDGLVGSAIHIGARIIALASDYDGLTSGILAERVYTSENALSALREGLHTHYDPQVAKALFEVLAELEAEKVADVAVPVADLLPRMVLAQDLVTPQGAILLPAGHVFQPPVIQKLTAFAERENLPLVLRILRKSLPPAVPAKVPVARKVAA